MNKTLALIAALGLVVSAPAFAAPEGTDTAKPAVEGKEVVKETTKETTKATKEVAKEAKAEKAAKEAKPAAGKEVAPAAEKDAK